MKLNFMHSHLIIILVFLSGVCGVFIFLSILNATQTLIPGCEIIERKMTVRGDSMQPIFQNADHVLIAWKYFTCHSPERGDLVIFRATSNQTNAIRRIVAVPGDMIEVKKNQFFINEELIENSEGDPYSINSKMEEWLLRGLDPDKKLSNKRYLILAENTENNYDSRYFGPIFIGQITGKVIE